MKGAVEQHGMFAMAYKMLGDKVQLLEIQPHPWDVYAHHQRVIASHILDMGLQVEKLMALPVLAGQWPSPFLA